MRGSTLGEIPIAPTVRLGAVPGRRWQPVAAELGLITRDLAFRTDAQAAFLAVSDPDGSPVRIADGCGAVQGRAALPSAGATDGHGFVERVLVTGDTAVGTIDPVHNPAFGRTVSGAPVAYAFGAAVRPPAGPVGALCVGYDAPPSHADPELTLWLVERYAGLAALCMYGAGVLEGVLLAARIDGLTGCLNHTAIRSELHRELERSERSHRPLSCCFIDLDRFKQVNDRHGHLQGSQVLAEVAAGLRGNIRLGDTLGRYGGDEFVAVLPDTDERAAATLVERLRCTISTTTSTRGYGPIGMSAGVAQARPGSTTDELLTAADDALRIAKGAGGGLVVGAGDVAAGASRGVAERLV